MSRAGLAGSRAALLYQQLLGATLPPDGADKAKSKRPFRGKRGSYWKVCPALAGLEASFL